MFQEQASKTALACALLFATAVVNEASASANNNIALYSLAMSSDVEKTGDGGRFGKWIEDESGLPAFEYNYLDGAAPNQSIREDHWHQVGNDRFTAEAHAGGWFVPYRWEHGLTRLADSSPKRPYALAGVGVIHRAGDLPRTDDNSTAPRDSATFLLHSELPEGTPWSVIWGEGYAEWRAEIDGLRIKRRVSAPFGDDSVLVIDVEIAGNGQGYEYEERWPVKPYALTFPAPMTKHTPPPKSYKFGPRMAWHAITGLSGTLRRLANLYRKSYSTLLKWKTETSPDNSLAVATPSLRTLPPRRAPGERSWRDLHPQPLFLAVGDGDDATISLSKGGGGVTFTALGRINAGEERAARFRFIFGWGTAGSAEELARKYRSGHVPGWKGHVPAVSAPGAPWLEREMSWHGYYLRSMLVYDEYFENHYLPQGSAYSYLHGIQGAPRDYALAAVSMIYLAPERAREMLLQMTRLMYPDGEMLYGHGGYGKNSSAGGMHAAPTDLPIFLLWAIVEYVESTGDLTILDERPPFYPKEKGESSTVRERIELAWAYIRDKVGVGPHGMLRVGTGDWNDPISLMVPNHKAFVKNGESAFNTAFAIYVLPRVAHIVEEWDSEQAADMRAFSSSLDKAMESAWTGRWYLRGWDGMGGPIGEDRLFLDSNVWCLIAGVGGEKRMAELVKAIGELNDDPSPIGANILDKPVKARFGVLAPGWDCNGGVWAAINGLLAWGYSQYDAGRAWKSLYKQSLAAHAKAYPDVWFGIWSGPDAYNAHYAERPGETFIHPLTPMQEYPVMNSNAHALPLLALIKAAGLKRDGGKMAITREIPAEIGPVRLEMPISGVK